MLKQQAKAVARFVYFLDIALTSAAFFLAFYVRDHALPQIFPGRFATGLFPLHDYLKIYPIVLIIWSLFLFTSQSYHSHRTVPLHNEAVATLRAAGFAIVTLATVAYLLPLRQLSRSWFILFGGFAALFLLLEKLALRTTARYVRSKGLNYRTIVIVGTGRRARDVVRLIEQHKWWGYKILGFISDGHRIPSGWSRYKTLGSMIEFRSMLDSGFTPAHEAIDEVVFAISRSKLEAARSLFRLCEELGIRTRVAMNFFPNQLARVEFEELEGVPFLTFTTTPSNETQLALKRMSDIVISMLLLVLSAPILLVSSIAIKLTSHGSVLFKQKRLGLNGRTFTLFKFRTMIENADQLSAEVEHLNEMSGPVFKAKDDPRVTPVGRFLRKFSLDELPQLWNVLRGDMSLVGPRPPIPEEVRRYERWQRRRLSMKPGLTCLWQVSGRNHVDFDRWIKLDLQYIDNWSPALDFKILLRTIPAVLLGRGAF